MGKTRAKGNIIQARCMKHLREQGWIVSKAEVGGKFVKEKDMFGLFDLVAIHKKFGVSFIQVTCNVPHTHKRYDAFAKVYLRKNIHVCQWVWYDFRGWKKFTYHRESKWSNVDERKIFKKDLKKKVKK